MCPQRPSDEIALEISITFRATGERCIQSGWEEDRRLTFFWTTNQKRFVRWNSWIQLIELFCMAYSSLATLIRQKRNYRSCIQQCICTRWPDNGDIDRTGSMAILGQHAKPRGKLVRGNWINRLPFADRPMTPRLGHSPNGFIHLTTYQLPVGGLILLHGDHFLLLLGRTGWIYPHIRKAPNICYRQLYLAGVQCSLTPILYDRNLRNS